MTPSLAANISNAIALEALPDLPGALRAYEAALEESPDLAEAIYNRADLLRRTGRGDDALGAYDRLIKLRPNWAAAHLNRGALLADQGRLREAIISCRTATQLEPENPAGWANLGNALSGLGRHAEAIAALQNATRLQPANVIAQFNLGNVLAAAGRTRDSAEALMRAVTLDPGFAAAAVNLSSRLRALGLTEAARDAARIAIQAAPTLPQAWISLGNAFFDLACFEEAETCHRRALALAPDSTAALVNLAMARAASGNFAEALALNEAAIARAPHMPEPKLGRATCLLALGDFVQGWPAYRSRFIQPGAQPRSFTVPHWSGGPIEGKKILIHAEQGFGDTLQFVRFAPRLAALGAKVQLEVQPPLLRLLKTLPGMDIIPRGAKPKAFDLHCPLMDLAGIFAPSLAHLAPAHPYLMAEPAWIAARKLPAAQGAKRIGLVWAGQARPELPHALAMDRRRSLKLAAFAPLAQLSASGRIQLVSLQFGPPAEQLKSAPAGLQIIDALHSVKDFAETAGVVAQLDLVIAVDTSTAHLAAAMGKPVWLLSRFDACWRWLHARTDSPWYPTLELFRQPRPNDWATPISQIHARLEEL